MPKSASLPATPGFEASIGMRLRSAYLNTHRSYNARFAPLGATADQYVMLRLLCEQDGITQQDLGRRMGSDPNTVTAMLALLEKRELVRREALMQDRRARVVYVTRKGARLLGRLDLCAQDLNARLSASLSSTDRAIVLSALASLADAMRPLK